MRCLSLKVISILILLIILAISQTVLSTIFGIICCNDAAYKVYHKCNKFLKNQRISTHQNRRASWYAEIEPDWKDPKTLGGTEVCYTEFCADGSEKSNNCGFGCPYTGCLCHSCHINNGTSYKDMEKVWTTQNGFTMICHGDRMTCDKVLT